MNILRAFPSLKYTVALGAAVLLSLLLVAPPRLQAQFAYATNGDALTITNYTGTNAILVIPPTNTAGLPITAIGSSALANNPDLTSVTFSDNITNIGQSAFEDDYSITNLDFGTNITEIGSEAFYSDSGLGSVTIPDSVNSIGDGAFQYCYALTNITFGTNVTSLGNYEFENDSSLVAITIPASVSSIGQQAFQGCSSLTSIMVDANNSTFSSTNGVLFDVTGTMLIEFPDGVTNSYTIDTNVTDIEEYAFIGSQLTSVTIGTNVVDIGYEAFYQDMFTNVIVPDSVTDLEDQAFSQETSLAAITLGTNLTHIGTEEFQGDTSLASIFLPASVISIGTQAFDSCSSLTNISVDSNNADYASVDGVLFDVTGSQLIAYPAGSLGPYVIDTNVTEIDDYAFADDSVTNVIIGTNVTYVGDYSFQYCSGLTSITIPASVTTIGVEAFYDCINLTNISVDPNNQNFSSLNGVLFTKDGSTIIQFPTGISGSYTIDSNVSNIGQNAFAESRLTSISIGTNVTSIGDDAFYNSSLTSVAIPGSVTNLGFGAFLYCYSLTNVIIEDGVTSIGADSFFDCSSLASVTFAGSVTNIGSDAFAFNGNLASLYFEGNAPAVDPTAFYNDNSAMVYFEPGAAGWGFTFGGLPTDEENPPPPLPPFTVLYSFGGQPDGASPVAGLIQASDGNFYGATQQGGTNNDGAIFRITTNGLLTNLFSFTSVSTGSSPDGTLVRGPHGQLYGTTSEGGPFGEGSVFRITTNGVFTNLYFFSGSDGAAPVGALLLGTDGNFYGTTTGDSFNNGTLFRITTNGVLSNMYSFNGGDDGGIPNGGLVQANDGNLYGTTVNGGLAGNGTVFRITTNGVLTSLHSFTNSIDGLNIYAGLALGGDGNLYGTASDGGTNGGGTVFQITTNGVVTVLHSFAGPPDGLDPEAALILGSDGNLYGTTVSGGTNDYGLVFEITTNGAFTNLYSFMNGNDGSSPYAGLVQGTDGNLYGTAADGGGRNNGSIFQISLPPPNFNVYELRSSNYVDPRATLLLGSDGNFYGTTAAGGGSGSVFQVTTNGVLSALYLFTGSDGQDPFGGLFQAADGNFYGTTAYGGANSRGTVFELTTCGTLNTLYSFSGDTDGEYPHGALVQGLDGNLYGTTTGGGANDHGTVFEITTNGALTVLWSFEDGDDGADPYAGLALGSDGNFYGTTVGDGEETFGSVFKITPNGVLTSLYSFTDGNDGAKPYGGLVLGVDGNFYGTTFLAGTNGSGSLFMVTPDGSFTNLHSFTSGYDGGNPYAGLLQGSDGSFYGTTYSGGASDLGTVFKYSTNGLLTCLLSFTGLNGGNPYGGLAQGPDGFYGTTTENNGSAYGSGSIFRLTGTNLPPPGGPNISIQPAAPPSTPAGLSVSFSVALNAPGYAAYQWYLDGVALTNGGDYSGATNSILTVDPASSGDTGSYTVVVSNAFGLTTSSNAFLSVSLVPSLSVLYNFTNYYGQSGVVQGPDGSLYGTLNSGGDNGDGAVFKVTTNGSFSILYSFGSVVVEDAVLDGANPNALILGSDGNFYGTTENAGTNGNGTVFEIDTSGNLTTLYAFSGPDGATPFAGLVQGSNGVFYGTTAYGGASTGTIFAISTNGGFSTLYEFQDGADGGFPATPLVIGTNGLLYGTTTQGGNGYNNSIGYGTIFKIDPSNTNNFSTLYTFGTVVDDPGYDSDKLDPSDGATANGLTLGSDGNFYGTTTFGGTNDDYLGTNGFDPNGASGNGDGTLFSITHAGNFTTIHNFDGKLKDGRYPIGSLVPGPNGNLYGVTAAGGLNDSGAVFVLNPSNSSGSNIVWLGNSAGGYGDNLEAYYASTLEENDGYPLPVASVLTPGPSGLLYCTTTDFGTNGDGTICQLTLIGTPALTWTNPAPIGFGTPLGSNQLNATANVPGTFVYNPTNGTVLPLGSHTLSVTFTPDDTVDFTNATAEVTILVTQGTPLLTWATPAPIPYGTPLSSIQLDAMAGIPGSFAYSPTNGTILSPGTNTLTAVFTPSDTNDYTTAIVDTTLVVQPSPDFVTLTSPTNGQTFAAGASLQLTATVTGLIPATAVNFYNGASLLGTATSTPYTVTIGSLGAGSYSLAAVEVFNGNLSVTSAVVHVTVNSPGTTLINFDPLASLGSQVSGASLANYLAQFGLSVSNNSPGTTVEAENQGNFTNGSGAGFVAASSTPNVLTQAGSNGTVSFAVTFVAPVSRFGFTRPELLASPAVSLPAWQAQAFDALGILLDEAAAPPIFSTTNVPAQIYTLNGGSISRVVFTSDGNGLTTINALPLDDFDLTAGSPSDLPPSVIITSPTNGQPFIGGTDIPINVQTAPGTGSVSGVGFYYDGSLTGSSQSSPYSIAGPLPANGAHVLTAVVTNNSGLTSTSAPVSITVATGFDILNPPLSQTVAIGGNATFGVTTTGTNATYQWRFNGLSIVGATSSSYTVNDAALTAAGDYSVAVVSDGQVVISPPAALTVLGPPTLGSPSIVTNGGNITLSVSASDGVPFYSQWQLNGNGIPGASNSFSAGTTNISFTITNARAFNSGQYRVVAANSVASVEGPVFDVAVSLGTPTTTNGNFASSLTFDPLTTNGVAGLNNSTASTPPADGPAMIAGKPAGGFLWYNWTASFSGVISLTTRGSSFDTLMGVYTGSSVSSLTPVAEDDDSGGFFTSLVIFNCVQGTKYQIAVAGYQGASGTVFLELSPGPADGFPGPTNGYSTSGLYPVITTEPLSQIVQAGSNVSLSVTASNATGYQWYFGQIPVSGGQSSTLVISNFSPNAVGNYYATVTNASGSVESTVATIEIAAESQNGTATRLLVDKFGDAVDLTGVATERSRPTDSGGETGGFTLSQSFSTVGATKEEGEPDHAGQPGGASYWYSYTATNSGTVTFTTTGSTFNTILAVYTGPGTSFSTLSNVGAAFTTNYTQQGQPSVGISNVVSGTKFFIAIDGYQGASGAAKLNIAFDAAPIMLNNSTITNDTPIVAITSPANNSIATGTNITVKGTVKGGVAGATVVNVTVNNSAPVQAVVQGTGWSTTNATLVPGPNLITAQGVAVSGTGVNFASVPVATTVFLNAAKPSASVKAPLTLLTVGDGKITGETTGSSLEIGKLYKVTAVPIGNNVFANWNSGTNTNNLIPLTGGAVLSFDMYTNLILQAVFVTNPFTGLGGVYNGLFYPAGGVTEQSSGFLTATLENKVPGAYSAKLLLDGGTYSFSGSFNLSLFAQAIVPRSGTTSVTVDMQLGTNDQLTGAVSENASNGWTSQLTADLAVFSKASTTTNYDGSYTLVIPPGGATNEPAGYGYATLTTSSAGAVAISGSLADKTTFSQSVTVSKDGYIPVYVSLYSKKGSLQGWLSLTNENSSGQAQAIQGTGVAWIKPAVAKSLYAAGFTNTEIAVLGSLYANGFDLTGGTLTIGDGTGTNMLTYTNVTIANNKLTVAGGEVTGAITSGTGVLSLTIKPAGGKSLAAKGVVTENAAGTNGAGWFLGTNESGFFLLQP